MDAAKVVQFVQALSIMRSRRAVSAMLAGFAAGTGIAANAMESDAKKKKKRKKKKKCKNCGPCKSCIKGKCVPKPNGTICGDACEECIAGVCGDPACFGDECLPNATCAFDCDVLIQDCPANCFCTAGTVGSDVAYCTVDPHPACATLTTCTSTAACPSGHVCQECDGANRCVPLCIP
jgi:hypothetical protein